VNVSSFFNDVDIGPGSAVFELLQDIDFSQSLLQILLGRTFIVELINVNDLDGYKFMGGAILSKISSV
jgi:hypothetical protein